MWLVRHIRLLMWATFLVLVKVVIFEPQYKPTTEDQAAKRALRIGQTKELEVLRFTCAGRDEIKIEEKILQKAKLRAYFTEAAFNAKFSTTSINWTYDGLMNDWFVFEDFVD